MPGHEGIHPRKDDYEISHDHRYSPDTFTPKKVTPPDPPVDGPARKRAAKAAGRILVRREALVSERTPPPDRQPPEQRDRIARDIGRTALRDTVQRPPDREP